MGQVKLTFQFGITVKYASAVNTKKTNKQANQYLPTIYNVAAVQNP